MDKFLHDPSLYHYHDSERSRLLGSCKGFVQQPRDPVLGSWFGISGGACQNVFRGTESSVICSISRSRFRCLFQVWVFSEGFVAKVPLKQGLWDP